jgi:hypothetical protein
VGGSSGTTTGGTSTGGTTTGGTATGGTATGGTATGGTATGGTATGGTATGGTMTGGTATGGTGGSSTGGSMAGSSTGGTVGGAGKGGTAGTGGTTAGTGGSAAGTGGTTGGAGKGGTGGTGGGGSTVLVHRYSFSGTDTTAMDSIGTAHGTIIGGTQAAGVVTLSGGTSDQYVDLPAGIVSVLSSATFEAWVTWTGGTANWQRVFDFGANTEAAGNQGTGTSYLFFTPRAQAGTAANCTGPANFPRVAMTPDGPTMESCVMGAAAFPTGSAHIAVSVGATLGLYINGAPIGTSITPSTSLSSIADTHNWLGRSQFSPDGEFAGTISEFRIYNTARSSAQISASYAAGPDTPPTQ